MKLLLFIEELDDEKYIERLFVWLNLERLVIGSVGVECRMYDNVVVFIIGVVVVRLRNWRLNSYNLFLCLIEEEVWFWVKLIVCFFCCKVIFVVNWFLILCFLEVLVFLFWCVLIGLWFVIVFGLKRICLVVFGGGIFVWLEEKEGSCCDVWEWVDNFCCMCFVWEVVMGRLYV